MATTPTVERKPTWQQCSHKPILLTNASYKDGKFSDGYICQVCLLPLSDSDLSAISKAIEPVDQFI